MDLSQYINIVQKVGSRYFIVAGIAFKYASPSEPS